MDASPSMTRENKEPTTTPNETNVENPIDTPPQKEKEISYISGKEEDGVSDEASEEKTESREDSSKDPFIDMRLLPSKCSYFFMECYGGSFVPYMVIFLKSVGLNVKEAGLITGIRLLSSSIAAPLWGYLADQTGRRKLIFAILCLGMAATIFPLPWVAKACSTVTGNSTSYRRQGTIKSLNNMLTRTNQNSTRYNIETHYHSFSSELFYVMLTLVFVSNIFSNPITGVTDSFVMNVVKSHPRRADYGKQRMFGAIGFGVSNFLAGFISDHYSAPSLSNYTAIFYVFLPSVLLFIPCGLLLASQTKWETEESTNSTDTSVNRETRWKLLVKTFKNFDNIFFMLSAFLIGIANAVVIGYLFVLMEDELNASKTIMGLSNLIASIIEILVFPFSNRILALFGGAIGSIKVAIFSYFVRLIIVSYIRNPWFVLPTQILNCLSFALFWTAAVEHTQVITPKEIYITMFSILNSVYFNVAGLVGYLGGGVVYSRYGGKVLFRATGYLCGIWVIIMILYYQVMWRVRRRLSAKKHSQEMPSTYTIDTVT